eukprot:Skav233755  [mRNA]  locus=scaffold1792:332415:338089:- [translate_table: standard]
MVRTPLVVQVMETQRGSINARSPVVPAEKLRCAGMPFAEKPVVRVEKQSYWPPSQVPCLPEQMPQQIPAELLSAQDYQDIKNKFDELLSETYLNKNERWRMVIGVSILVGVMTCIIIPAGITQVEPDKIPLFLASGGVLLAVAVAFPFCELEKCGCPVMEHSWWQPLKR